MIVTKSRKIKRKTKHSHVNSKAQRRQTCRYSERKRTMRIYTCIQSAGSKGISERQIARHERLSLRRTRYYLRLMDKSQNRRNPRIASLNRRYYYVRLPTKPRIRVKPRIVEHTPSLWTLPQHGDAEVELRGYSNYMSFSQSSRNIEIDCVMLVPYNWSAIVAGTEQIKDMVEARLGSKLVSMLKFGVSGVTPNSANHFLYRRQGGGWVEL